MPKPSQHAGLFDGVFSPCAFLSALLHTNIPWKDSFFFFFFLSLGSFLRLDCIFLFFSLFHFCAYLCVCVYLYRFNTQGVVNAKPIKTRLKHSPSFFFSLKHLFWRALAKTATVLSRFLSL